MDSRELFLRTLGDLLEKTRARDDYLLLRSSHLLRQLLFDDGRPLYQTVNEQHRLRIRFDILKPQFPGDPASALMWTRLPTVPRPGTPADMIEALSIDALLAYEVIGWHGVHFSIKDVIEIEAHVSGGVHLGPARSEKLKILDALTRTSQLMGHETARTVVQHIGLVVLHGLHPLAQAVHRDLTDSREKNAGQPAIMNFVSMLDQDALDLLRSVAERHHPTKPGPSPSDT